MDNKQVAEAVSAAPRLIEQWLGLPQGVWPPDHYTLLALRPGEIDMRLIENAVHDRMARVRAYQISHPEQATEAMNRLAEAYACLSDPACKEAYDDALGIIPPKRAGRDTVTDEHDTQRLDSPAPPQEIVEMHQAATVTYTPEAPPPVRGGAQEQSTAADTQPVPAIKQEPPSALPADPLLEAARASFSARVGIATRKGLLRRVKITQDLLVLWRRLGRYFKNPKTKLKSDNASEEINTCLERIDRLLYHFPSFLGKPGKPGYRMAMLARDEQPADVFANMRVEERKALAKEWVTSVTLLNAHMQFLNHEMEKRRHESFVAKALRLLQAFLRVYGKWLLVASVGAVLIFLAIVLLFFRQY